MQSDDDFFGMSLRELVDWRFLVLAVLIALSMEYFLIIVEVFADFPTVFASLQLYIIFTILMFIVYMVGFKLRWQVAVNIYIRATVFIILPIGFLWAIYQGYVVDELFSWWLFVSDFIYVLLATQYVVIVVLFAGIRGEMVASVKRFIS